jgi:gas vesicle protein
MVKRRNLAVGGLAIAGLSYLAGILTAPKSGRETRKDLQKAALKAKAESERKLKKAHSELSDLLDQASKTADRSKTKLTDEWKSIIEHAESVRNKSRELLSAVHEGEAEDRDLQRAIAEAKKSITHVKKYIGKKVTS